MKAALWLRVSTSEQHTDNQVPDLERVCSARSWEIVERYDVTASAFKGDHRAMLDTLLTDASHGRFQVLCLWALDRLTREGGEETIRLLGQLADRGVTVVSFTEPWVEDMRDPMVRKFMIFFSGWIAESESRRRKERTLAGLARARVEGKRIGRPPGRKDDPARPRKKSGYFYREARKREALPNNSPKEPPTK